MKINKIIRESLDEHIVNPSNLNEEQAINPKLASHVAKQKTPQGVYNVLLKILDPFFKKRYSDEDWAGIRGIIDVIKSTGADVTVNVNNGGYRKSPEGAECKEYKLDCIFNDTIVLNLSLVAYACGTVENPWSVYDVSLNA